MARRARVTTLYEAGDTVTKEGEQALHMMILFSGRVVIRADRGAGSHKIFEWKGGDVGGAMPYSRGASPPRDACAEERTEIFAIDKDTFPELTRACPVVTAALVHIMLDRARQFTSADLRDEKLVSLGKLAAGLAHELNNPASAVVRSSKILIESLTAAEEASRILAGAGLTPAQFAAIDRARAMCDAARGNAPSTAARARATAKTSSPTGSPTTARRRSTRSRSPIPVSPPARSTCSRKPSAETRWRRRWAGSHRACS